MKDGVGVSEGGVLRVLGGSVATSKGEAVGEGCDLRENALGSWLSATLATGTRKNNTER